MEYNLADLFESVVDVVPDREALVYADHPGTGAERRLTYAELDAAANRIATKPYIWGGGHGRWWDRGYDCSGSVSYALHGGRLLSTQLDSTSLESYGSGGHGRWVTIYANAGHAWMIVAGLRFDTSGQRTTGSRWQTAPRSNAGFTVRHPTGW